MNIFTQLATQFLINKNILVQLLQKLNFSKHFVDEFRNNNIYIDENRIRQRIRILCDITQDETFKDLFCHDNGIQLVFYTTPREYRFIQFRISFDIKIIGIILNNQEQSMQMLISNIKIKSLNHLSKPFRFCIQSKARTLVTDELERICTEQCIPYERLFKDIKRPLAYRINLSSMKELDQLRKRYFIIGNRSILDLIQITCVEHREQAIVLGYRLKPAVDEKTTMSSIQQLTIEKNSIRPGDIQSVIDTIDRFGWTKQWLMNIGDRKGKILDDAIRTRKPKSVLELGTFLGYSSLRMAAQLPNDTLIISIERDSKSAEIAHTIHEHAGVGNRIKIIIDLIENVIPRLNQQYHIHSFDFIFIDHYGEAYLRDFMLLEQFDLIKSGTMIVADNVIFPGAPNYLNYIKNNPNYITKTYESTLEYDEYRRDGVEISIRK